MDRVEFEGHPLWAAVEELQDLLVRADEVADPAHFEMLDQLRYEQLRYVIRSVKSRRPPLEATEAARAKLDRLRGHVDAAATELAAYLSDRDGAHLTVAVGLVDWALLDLGVKGRAKRHRAGLRRAEPQAPQPRAAPVPPPSASPRPEPEPVALAADSEPTVRLYRARHARRTHDRSVVFSVGIIALIAAAIGSVLGSGTAGNGSPGVASKGAAAACTVLRVVSPASYLPALDAVSDDVERGDDCLYLDLTVADGQDAGHVVEAEQAHVWIADDAGWLTREGVAGSVQTLATSPVLFASNSAMATAIDQAGGGWSGLAHLIDSGANVQIVTTDPATSGDGLVALGALGEAGQGASALDPALLLDRAFHQHRTAQQLVGSGIATDEVALVPEHLLGGAVAAQGVVKAPGDRTALMRYSWYATNVDADAPAIQSARERLLETLTQGATAERAMVAAHLRDAQGWPPATAGPGVWGGRELAPSDPVLDASQVDRVLATWHPDERRADLLVVVDVSAAMAAPAPGSRRPLITLVRNNLVRLAARMPDESRLGVWAFGSGVRGPRDYAIVDPLRPLTEAHRSSLDARLERLVAGDTGDGFYDAVLAAYRSAVSARWSDVDFRVMVLTAGSHAGDPGSLSVGQLRKALARVAGTEQPVELTVVKLGGGPARTLDHALRPVGGEVESIGSAEGVVAAFVRLAVGDLHR